jgi:adiponectin receptor
VAFLISALICLFFSAVYHTVYVLSSRVNSIFLRLDYAGVNFLICGSVMPLTYYGFYCRGNLGLYYMTGVGIMCTGVFIVSLKDFIHTTEYIVIKNWMYALLGIFSALPLFHLALFEAFT